MSPQNFGLVIRAAAKNVGLVRVATKLDATGKVGKALEVAALSTHDLRHTYAVWTYLLLRTQGDTNPWLFIQAQLGHRSAETTLNTYLRAVRMFENEISEIFADLVRSLGEMLEGGSDDEV
jgi:integrase